PQARTDAALRYTRGTQDLRLSAELPPEWREIIQSCLTPAHTTRPTAKDLLRRVESATESTRSPRLPRLRPRRVPRLRLAAAILLAGAMTATYAYAENRSDGPTYGYHRCPYPSVCFFSGPNGTGEMCSWRDADPDWLSGRETCMWSATIPVRSIYYNADESTGLGGVAYYRGRNYVPVGIDITRPNSHMRTGCTAQRNQGNLAGTYSPLSHQLIVHCG
ncbi:peptidase inhibitor family I36 protein, partial [Streptomyces niveiscabiei]